MMGVFYAQSYRSISSILILLVAIVLVVLVGYLLMSITDKSKKINLSILGIMLLVFFVVAIIWVKAVPSFQVSDFGNFWTRAPGFLKGGKLYQTDNDYFSKYAYQSGFMAYVIAMVKIFGFHIFPIQFMNVVYQTLILLVTYLLTVKLFNNIKMARLSVLLLMIDLDWFALNSQASNQYLGSLLYMVTFYLIMQDKMWSYIVAGITLTLGCLIRPIGPVIIAGIVVFAIVYLMFNKGKFDYKKPLKVVLTLVIYLVLFSLAGWGVKASGLNAYGLSNHDPQWKFVTGLNYQSKGVYTSDLDRLIDADKTRAQMRKKEQAAIKSELNYLNSNHKWPSLFINKVSILWSQRTLATDFTNYGSNHSPQTVQKVNYLAYIGSILLILFSWIGSIRLFKVKFSKNLYLLILPLMAFAVVQLIIEVQGRYRIEFLPVISIIASVGLAGVCQFIKEKIFHRV